MDYELIKSLLLNVTLMISLLYIMSRIWPNYYKSKSNFRNIAFVSFGAAILSILCMVFPVFKSQNFQYDLRSIPVVLTGMTCGIVPAMITASLSSIFRVLIGGGAVFSGIITGIVIPAIIGGMFYWGCRFLKVSLTAESKLRVWNMVLMGILMWIKDNITLKYLLVGGSELLNKLNVILLLTNVVSFVVMGLIIKDNITFSRSNLELKEDAFTDDLTKLKNYRYIANVVYKFAEESQESSEHFCVMMADIDDFKKYNDTYGHLEGDKVLKTLSRILMASVRESDIVARYGGEEFLVVLRSTDLEGACKTAERIRKNADDMDYSSNGSNGKRSVTISIGVSEFPLHGTNMHDLINKADIALYKAKEKGKNNVQIYKSEGMN